MLTKDRILVITGKIAYDDYLDDFKVTADKIYDLEEARDQFAGRLVLKYRSDDEPGLAQNTQDLLNSLQNSLEPHLNGNCRVIMAYKNQHSGAYLEFGDQWRVTPNKLMVENLQNY